MSRLCYALHGDACPLDADAVANVAMAAALFSALNGIFFALAPAEATRLIRRANATLVHERLMEATGFAWLGIAAIAWSLFYVEASVTRALGAACSLWAVYHLKWVLNDTPKQLSLPASSTYFGYFGVAINVFSGYALLTDAAYAGLVMKVIAIVALLEGVLMGFKPKVAVRTTWGMEADDLMCHCIRGLGFTIASAGVFAGSLEEGIDDTTAFGYSFVPFLVANAMAQFVTGDVEKFGLSRAMHSIYLIVTAFFICALV